MTNSINNLKSNFNNLQNTASKSSLTDYLPTQEFKTTVNFGKKLQKKIRVKLVAASKGIHNLVNSTLGNSIINISIFGILVIAIGILMFFYKKLKTNLKMSLKYLILSLVSLLVSMYGVSMVLPKTSLLSQLISILLVGVCSFLFVLFVVNLIKYFKSIKIDAPWIIKGTKNGKNSLVIPQDSENPDTVILYRSDNQESGIEFTYSFWTIIQDYNYNKDKPYKHIFHKGDATGDKIYCPKVVFKNNNNTLSISMNLIDNTNTQDIDIENIPIDKWFHVSLVLKQRLLEIYINGNLKKTMELKTIPRQNFNNLWVNLDGGFEGFLSKFQYHRRALGFEEIESIVNKGPSTDSCSVTGIKPPYFDDNWWLDRDEVMSSSK